MAVNAQDSLEVREDVKTIERAGYLITQYRSIAQPVVDSTKSAKNREYLFGETSDEEIKKMFNNPDNIPMDFKPIAVFEKIRNILIAELKSEGIYLEAQSTDSLANNQKAYDKKLLKNKGIIEGTMTALNGLVGRPAYRLKDQQKEDGSPLFNGNIEQFDELGFEAGNDQDINHFFDYFYRLKHEMVVDEPIRYFFQLNQLEQQISTFVNDILCDKVVANQTFLNENAGNIQYQYILPSNLYTVGGTRKDYKDCTAILYEQQITIHNFLKFVGNDIDLERDIKYLIQAANYKNKTGYTSVGINGTVYYGSPNPGQGQYCEYSDFLNIEILIGYIEWKEINASSYKITEKNYHGNMMIRPLPLEYNVSERSSYKKEVKYKQDTYRSYYAVTGSNEQKLYKYSKLFYQPVEGAYDEFSGFSISIYKEDGKPAMEVVKPFIDFIIKNFKKFEFMVIKAKPPGRAYNYETLIKVSKLMYPDAGNAVGIKKVLDLFASTSNEIYTIPELHGNPVGGGMAMNYDIPHGLADTVLQFKDLYDWGYAQMSQIMGISENRIANNVEPRESLKLNLQANSSSQNATQYIREMLYSLYENTANRTMLLIQDIVKFKDKGTLAYKYLINSLGYETVGELSTLDNIALHRYNLFFNAFNPVREIADKEQKMNEALFNKLITLEQYLLVKSIKSPRRAIAVLSYMQRRNERVQQEMQAKQAESQMQLEQMKHEHKMQEINLEGELRVKAANAQGYWYAQAQAADANAQMELQSMKSSQRIEEIAAKKDASIEEDIAKANSGV